MVGVDGGVSVDLQRVDVVTARHRIKHWTSKNTSVPDPCNFGTNPDPWIRTGTTGLRKGSGSRSCFLLQCLSRC